MYFFFYNTFNRERFEHLPTIRNAEIPNHQVTIILAYRKAAISFSRVVEFEPSARDNHPSVSKPIDRELPSYSSSLVGGKLTHDSATISGQRVRKCPSRCCILETFSRKKGGRGRKEIEVGKRSIFVTPYLCLTDC